jgi:hypothetical protein
MRAERHFFLADFVAACTRLSCADRATFNCGLRIAECGFLSLKTNLEEEIRNPNSAIRNKNLRLQAAKSVPIQGVARAGKSGRS